LLVTGKSQKMRLSATNQEIAMDTRPVSTPSGSASSAPKLPGQVVLVLQGGGALGAYQGGIYEALHEAGIEPDWVIGTSIGAVNAGIIAGNAPDKRADRLREFWTLMEYKPWWEDSPFLAPWLANTKMLADFTNEAAHMMALFGGVPGYYAPNKALAWGAKAPLGVDRAALYTTGELDKTMTALTDPTWFNSGKPRLTVGTVNVKSGRMQYWDSARMPLSLTHVLASTALPPAFPAVLIDGEPYWDGGIYSNTPIEAVFDDNPRRNSIVFADQVWHTSGPAPQSLEEVLSRQKDIQFGSRDDSHIARQQQLHRLRHVVRELVKMVPEDQRDTPEVKKLAAWGCGTFMHIVQLNAPYVAGEGNTRDVDFTRPGIRVRWKAGHDDTARALEKRPWDAEVDETVGVAIHHIEPQVLGNL
jgi:NTE family protein